MATIDYKTKGEQLEFQNEQQKMRNLMLGYESQLAKEEKELGESRGKGKIIGTALGLLGATLLTAATGGAGGALIPKLIASAKTVAGSPLLAGVGSGLGSMAMERYFAKDDVEDIEEIVDKTKTLTGPGTLEFGKKVDAAYGDIGGEVRAGATMGGITTGLSIGSMAGGMDKVFAKDSIFGKWLAKNNLLPATPPPATASEGVTFMSNIKKSNPWSPRSIGG